ncbi:MAG TPA: 4'-phosphopantetheinyl transferase superfamily protein [Anaerolinea sp.]|nr:4'-phosphopantetheinyl transferase superfamily protein [Anaerolinea sp.]
MTGPIFWTFVTGEPPAGNWLTGEGQDFLSPAEQDLLGGLRFERRRSEWLLGRWAAKHLVRDTSPEVSGLPFSAFSVLNEEGGAPYAVDEYGKLIPGCLSISHRAGAATCAWTNSPDIRIGIDVEWVERRDPSFLGDYFTESEQAFATALPETTRDVWITLAWSVKESVLKALRTGLRIDTRKIQVVQAKGLFETSQARAGWMNLSVRGTAVSDGVWQARWLRRGEFVVTLVCHYTEGAGGEPEIKERLVEPPFVIKPGVG